MDVKSLIFVIFTIVAIKSCILHVASKDSADSADEDSATTVPTTPVEKISVKDNAVIDIDSDKCQAAKDWLSNNKDHSDRETLYVMRKQWTVCVTGDESFADDDAWYGSTSQPETTISVEVEVEDEDEDYEVNDATVGAAECQSILDEANELTAQGFTDHLSDYIREYEDCVDN